jgi:UDP-perosamine 4-acetyltransferase
LTRRPCFIFGRGGHAHVIKSLLPERTIRFVVDIDPHPDDISPAEFFAGRPDADAEYYLGIGDDRARRKFFDQLKSHGLTVSTCIAPTAWIARDALLGEGAFVGPGAVIGARARVGANVIVNTLSSIDHDCEIGDDVQLTAAVTLGSWIKVGRGCYFGMKSCVIPRVEIGEGTVVMAGALVVRSAPAGVMLGGAPARIIRDFSPEAAGR